MKYLKMLALAAIAAGALMAFAGAGTASATELTCSAGVMCPAGTVIHATSPKAVLDSPLGNVECESTVEGKAKTGSSTETVKSEGELTVLSFTKCNHTVVVIKKGTLEVHTDPANSTTANGNGILTSNGAEVTVEEFGFHCIYTTENTEIGTVNGSNNTGGTATMTINARIPRTGGRSGSFCGESAPWTGTYTVDNPMFLAVD